ncbi:S41 family peptidase [Woodsholea maritima]|uniref:S41 family peptidase n=1 Tax=Woodsholea maritima TaxID=240237 RepID=UPI0003A59080|nr:S41 family peptidase [Woodsholea maritima]
MRLHILASAVAFGLGAAALAMSAEGEDRSREETFRQLELFGDVLARIEADYVSDPDKAELIENAIEGMMKSLDPHSGYLNAEDFRDMQVSQSGSYGGLGLEVTIRDDLVTIIAPMAGTPADNAGLRTNDRIVAVDGDSMIGAGIDEAVDRMRGAVGEPVTLTIAREGEDAFDVTIVRDTIEVTSASWRVVEETIPYLRLMGFNENTTDNALQGLQELQDELGRPLPGLILDLRNNPGGLVDQAVSISDLFLDGGEVVSMRGRHARDTQRYNATPGERLPNVPVVILINEGSASASEIVTGALQDRQRATVVGMTSFGKGSMQTVIPLRGGRDGALRLTTARYYTPAGRSIQGTGIAPDIAVSYREIKEDAPRRFTEANLPNALTNENGSEREELDVQEIEQPPADWPEGEDYQLHRAVEVLHAMMERQQASLH